MLFPIQEEDEDRRYCHLWGGERCPPLLSLWALQGRNREVVGWGQREKRQRSLQEHLPAPGGWKGKRKERWGTCGGGCWGSLGMGEGRGKAQRQTRGHFLLQWDAVGEPCAVGSLRSSFWDAWSKWSPSTQPLLSPTRMPSLLWAITAFWSLVVSLAPGTAMAGPCTGSSQVPSAAWKDKWVIEFSSPLLWASWLEGAQQITLG